MNEIKIVEDLQKYLNNKTLDKLNNIKNIKVDHEATPPKWFIATTNEVIQELDITFVYCGDYE